METIGLSDTERFFYEYAGFCVNPGETEDQARVRGARTLAAAESRLTSGPYFIQLEPDPEPWDADVQWDGPVWVVSLWTVAELTEPTIMGSIGQVGAHEGDDYLRVVAAELADEWIEGGA